MPILDQIFIILGAAVIFAVAALAERSRWRDRAKTDNKRGKLFYTKGKFYKTIETGIVRVKEHGWFQLPDKDTDILKWHIIIDTPKEFKDNPYPLLGRVIKTKDGATLYRVDKYYFIDNKQLVIKVDRIKKDEEQND